MIYYINKSMDNNNESKNNIDINDILNNYKITGDLTDHQIKLDIESKLPDYFHENIQEFKYNYELKNNKYKFKNHEGDIKNIFNNNSPAIHFRNRQILNDLSGRITKYNGEKFNIKDRFFVIPEKLNQNSSATFNNKNNFKSHMDLSGSLSGTAGGLTGDMIYDFAKYGSTDIGARDVTRAAYNAIAWEGFQAGTIYTAAMIFGSEVAAPLKFGYAVLDYNAVLKHELDYLIKENIFTAENIAIARINARLIACTNVFSAELQLVSKVGKLIKNTSISAISKINSRLILDQYNYNSREGGTSIYVFKTKYIDYPIITIIGGVHDVIDGGIELTGDLLEGGYYLVKRGFCWAKNKITGNKKVNHQIKDIHREVIKEIKHKTEFNEIKHEEIKPETKHEEIKLETKHEETKQDNSSNINSESKHEETKQDDSSNINSESKHEETKQDDSLNINSESNDDDIIQIDTDDLNSPDDNDNNLEILNPGREKSVLIMNNKEDKSKELIAIVKKIKQREKCIILAQRLNQFNKFLEGANLIKDFKHMSKFQQKKQLIGLVLRNFQSSTMTPEGLKIIHTFGNLWSKEKLELKDIVELTALFPNIPDPVTNMLKIGFAMIEGKPKEIEQAFLGVALSILAAANPVFAVGQVLYTTVKLLDQLFTTRKIIDIAGIQAVYTDKIKIGFFEKKHKCTIVNQKLGINVSSTKYHKSSARRDAEDKFNKQVHYKFYEVIGLPSSVVDPNFVKPTTRIGKILFNQYLQSMYSNWLSTNKKYFSEKDFELLEREFFETPEQKELRLWLNNNGFENSWFSKHSSENPFQFSVSVWNEIKDLGFVNGLKHFFNLFQCNELKSKPLTQNEINQIKDKAENNARDSRNKDDNNQLDKFNDSETNEYNSQVNKYSKTGLLIKMQKDLLVKHISVGYIVNSGLSSLACSIGGSIAYMDKEIVMIYHKPITYICYKSEQFANSAVQGYVANALTEHVILIPTILMSEKEVSDKLLEQIAPYVGIGTGCIVNAAANCISGKSGKEILKNSFVGAANQMFTTGLMKITKDTAIMKTINNFSKSQALFFLKLTGLAIPHTFVSSVITSAVLCVTQRIIIESGKIVYKKVDQILNKPSEKAVLFWDIATRKRVNNIFQEYGQNDPFFKENPNNDLFFGNNNNLGALQIRA